MCQERRQVSQNKIHANYDNGVIDANLNINLHSNLEYLLSVLLMKILKEFRHYFQNRLKEFNFDIWF
jgi:hypothetical protein